MKLESEAKAVPDENFSDTYPKVVQTTAADLIVLAYDDNLGAESYRAFKGVVIQSDNPNFGVGYHSDTWQAKSFIDYFGDVVIHTRAS